MLEGIAAGLPKTDRRSAAIAATADAHRRTGLAAVTGEHYEGGHWLRSVAVYLVTKGFQASCRSKLTSPRFLLNNGDEWTLNESLTRLGSYRRCSKRRTLGHSMQATSLPPIGGMTGLLPIALGSDCGSILAFVADLSLTSSD